MTWNWESTGADAVDDQQDHWWWPPVGDVCYGSGLEGGNRHGPTAVVSYPADWTECRQRSRWSRRASAAAGPSASGSSSSSKWPSLMVRPRRHTSSSCTRSSTRCGYRKTRTHERKATSAVGSTSSRTQRHWGATCLRCFLIARHYRELMGLATTASDGLGTTRPDRSATSPTQRCVAVPLTWCLLDSQPIEFPCARIS